MRVGLFGGSFDPVHQGHLILAEQCREQASLDEVWWIPAATSPLKESGPVASDRQRLEMLQLATAGHEAFRILDLELTRGGTSYTVETLETLRQQHPEHTFYWLMGSDSVESFERWREPARICQLATPLVYFRPGSITTVEPLRKFVDAMQFSEIEKMAFISRQIDISSTDLRERIATGRTIRYLTPRAVEQYILHQKIYQA